VVDRETGGSCTQEFKRGEKKVSVCTMQGWCGECDSERIKVPGLTAGELLD
jgi:hypothetical protein